MTSFIFVAGDMSLNIAFAPLPKNVDILPVSFITLCIGWNIPFNAFTPTLLIPLNSPPIDDNGCLKANKILDGADLKAPTIKEPADFDFVTIFVNEPPMIDGNL